MTEVSVCVTGKGKVIMCVTSVCAYTHTYTQICILCGSEPGRHFLVSFVTFLKKSIYIVFIIMLIICHGYLSYEIRSIGIN